MGWGTNSPADYGDFERAKQCPKTVEAFPPWAPHRRIGVVALMIMQRWGAHGGNALQFWATTRNLLKLLIQSFPKAISGFRIDPKGKQPK
jgi:hypothetical protein